MAAAMYARVFCSWFGARAPRLARDQLEKLRKRGDALGVEIWAQVVTELDRLSPRSQASRRTIPKRLTTERARPNPDTRSKWLYEKGGGTRANSSDRSAMIEVFSQRFSDLSKRELGKLFDKYRLTARIDIRWDGQSGQYIIDWLDAELDTVTSVPHCTLGPPAKTKTAPCGRR
jgi:hypothetical protein